MVVNVVMATLKSLADENRRQVCENVCLQKRY